MASTPSWPNLVQGNTGKNVSALQCLLNYRNNNTALVVDGSFGPALYNAVVAYQRSNGIPANGQAGPSTLAKLVTTVQSVTANNAARAAQYLLSKFESLTIDGSFGPGTASCTKTFQQKMDIPPDGSVGAQTWQYLFGYSAYPGGGTGISEKLTIPNRNCCWNQRYSGITSAINGSLSGCTITTALDLVNFYGPNSYTIHDIKSAWGSGGMEWGYDFSRCGSALRVKGSSEKLTGSAAFAAIRDEIHNGHPVIVNMGTGNSDNHTVMCYGYTNGGTQHSHFLVMDPIKFLPDSPSGKLQTTMDGSNHTLQNAMDNNGHPQGIWCIRRTYKA